MVRRRAVVVRLGRPHLCTSGAGARLVWTAHKNRDRHPMLIDIPVLAPLAQALRAGPLGDMTFLITEPGKAFTANGFGNWFKARCREAGLTHCSAHDMRKAAATRAAENGASAHGHVRMVEHERSRALHQGGRPPPSGVRRHGGVAAG